MDINKIVQDNGISRQDLAKFISDFRPSRSGNRFFNQIDANRLSVDAEAVGAIVAELQFWRSFVASYKSD